MRALLGSTVFAALLVSCFAACRPGLNGWDDWYHCDGLNDLANLQVPPTAKGINITNSNISRIKTDAFKQYSGSLLELNITGCGIEEIEPDAFRGLAKLEKLCLVNNKIRKIDASWIRGLPNLKTLNIWRNRIVAIDDEFYELLPELRVWDIAHNQLNECLSPALLKKLTNLRVILIAGNPWPYRCRALMIWNLRSNYIRVIEDWSEDISNLLIRECIFHEPGANENDDILNKCVDRKVGSSDTLPYDVASLNEQVRELSKRVAVLEADVATLKKSNV